MNSESTSHERSLELRPKIENCRSPLYQCVVSAPEFLDRVAPINPRISKTLSKGGINVSEALRQHENLVRVLGRLGVDVIRIPPPSDLPHFTFTRDIGFAIGKRVFLSHMATKARDKEPAYFEHFLPKEVETHHFENPIEGGDVMRVENRIFVGVGGRTTVAAADELSAFLGGRIEVVPVEYDLSEVHLDCVVTIVDKKRAIALRGAIPPSSKLRDFYPDLLEFEKNEIGDLGLNVLWVDENRAVICSEATGIILEELGCQSFMVKFDEVIKAGGALRCCTLPIPRSLSLCSVSDDKD